MKDLSIEQKAKRYDEAIEKAEKWHNAPNVDKIPTFGNRIIEDIFPELYESEDERIRKTLRKRIIRYDPNNEILIKEEGISQKQFLAWLEKQGEQKSMKVYRVENEAEQKGLWRRFDGTYQPLFDMLTDGQCKDLPMEDNPIYREGGKRWFASAPSKETLQKWFSKKDLEELVSKGFTISEFEVVGYKKVSDFEYIFTRDNIINRNYLEVSDIYPEQKDFAPKVEPKFKVGDWVIVTVGDLSATLQIAKVDINKERYWFNDGSVLPFADEECLHLWTIKDANAGDVLYYNDDIIENEIIVIFKYFHDDSSFCSYCYIDGGVFFTSNDRTPVWWMNNVFYPATKEQRDLFFKKMQESGYEWNADKKELVEQMTDEEQDETIYDMSFEEAQDYISKRGFDIPWNDDDVMVDERKLTQTVANVLKWADMHPLILPVKKK